MRHIISILLLACISLSSYAQTPYDSFAPETSRPVLELSEIKESKEGSKNTALTDTVVILDVDVRRTNIPTFPLTLIAAGIRSNL